MNIRVGTCGWAFDDWRGTFYPPGTSDQLVYYTTQFSAVEIDSTWYHSPPVKTVESWRRRSPDGFIFCPKLPREITHERLLQDSEALVADFTGSMSRLGDKLGPILVQLSPKFQADRFEVLEGFLAALPGGFRYAVEFRHRSWLDHKDALSLLSDLGMAVTMADHPWYPRMPHVTADFTYVRLLGKRDVFPDYSRIHRARHDDLAEWAEMLEDLPDDLSEGFVFINNQFEGHSPDTARKLLALLGEPTAGKPPTLFD